jgi:Astacin (Peptidase family M12A)
MVSQFEKYDTLSSNTQNTSYDYTSVMHYGKDDFTANSSNTLEPLQPYVKIGQRYFLSSIDIAAIRMFYNCSGVGTTLPTPTTTPAPRKHTHQKKRTVSF